VEAASSFEKILKSGECQKLRDPGDRLGGYAGALIPGDDYLRALRLCQKWRQWFVQAMDDRFDVLVAPSMVDVASPIAEDDEPNPGYRGPAVIQGANLVGLPAIAVPIGVTQSGLPTSMQIVGKIGKESEILAVARLFQQATDHHRKTPPVSQ
jgi:aspartyl-tRNA(Asn)/glutamyl-tRNA(Gln) amidotransferase subunit A